MFNVLVIASTNCTALYPSVSRSQEVLRRRTLWHRDEERAIDVPMPRNAREGIIEVHSEPHE